MNECTLTINNTGDNSVWIKYPVFRYKYYFNVYEV